MDDIIVFEYTGEWGGGVVFVDKNDDEAMEHYTDKYNKKDYDCLGTLTEFNTMLLEIKAKPTKRGRMNRFALMDYVRIE